MPTDEVWIPCTPEYVLEHGGRVTLEYEISAEWDRPIPDAVRKDARANRMIYDAEESARRYKEDMVRRMLASTYPNANIISLRISGRQVKVVLDFRPKGRRMI